VLDLAEPAHWNGSLSLIGSWPLSDCWRDSFATSWFLNLIYHSLSNFREEQSSLDEVKQSRGLASLYWVSGCLVSLLRAIISTSAPIYSSLALWTTYFCLKLDVGLQMQTKHEWTDYPTTCPIIHCLRVVFRKYQTIVIVCDQSFRGRLQSCYLDPPSGVLRNHLSRRLWGV